MGLSAHADAGPGWSDRAFEDADVALCLHGRPNFTPHIWQQLASPVVGVEHTVLVRAYLELERYKKIQFALQLLLSTTYVFEVSTKKACTAHTPPFHATVNVVIAAPTFYG